MTSNKKEFKLKYILIPIAGLIGTIAAIFAYKKIQINNF